MHHTHIYILYICYTLIINNCIEYIDNVHAWQYSNIFQLFSHRTPCRIIPMVIFWFVIDVPPFLDDSKSKPLSFLGSTLSAKPIDLALYCTLW